MRGWRAAMPSGRRSAPIPDGRNCASTPGLSDAEIVSNITNYLVSPLGFSQIR